MLSGSLTGGANEHLVVLVVVVVIRIRVVQENVFVYRFCNSSVMASAADGIHLKYVQLVLLHVEVVLGFHDSEFLG